VSIHPKGKEKIKKGQIYMNLKSKTCIEIIGKKGVLWKARKLTGIPNKFNGTHTLNPRTLHRGYVLLK